jgi:hypothetical protein
MPRKKPNPVVNPDSPDGLPAETPPLNEEGEVEIPEVEFEHEDDYDLDQCDHE